jgi:hypothetical protein
MRDGVDLCVISAATAVETLGDDPAVPDNDGAHQGIRADAPFPLPRQRESPLHEPLIKRSVFFVFHNMLFPFPVGLSLIT